VRLFSYTLFLSLSLLLVFGSSVQAADLPVLDPGRRGIERLDYKRITNLLSVEQLRACLSGGPSNSLLFDASSLRVLLNGESIQPDQITGHLETGPWPFEAKETAFSYRRFRRGCSVKSGHARLKMQAYCEERCNSEDWVDRGELMLRFDLTLIREGRDLPLGRYDFPLRFQLGTTDSAHPKKQILKLLPTLHEGPMVCRVSSDLPGTAVVAFVTDRPCKARVEVLGARDCTASATQGAKPFTVNLQSSSSKVLDSGDPKSLAQEKERTFEILLTGLPTGEELLYRVCLDGEPASEWEPFNLPAQDQSTVRFAYFGDTRSGAGGGESAHGGVNLDTIENLTALAHSEGAEFFLVGGDLISGYTTSSEDFSGQLYAWKQAMAGFWRNRPVYPAQGNHEALIHRFAGQGDESWLGLDSWPYETHSTEALFAKAFCNPTNAPEASPGLPSYSETVYSFRHGCVKSICFNNNYWVTSHADRYGGAPEGSILEDQMAWIEQEILAAEADPSVAHILLYAQEPAFPCGGHVQDAMWYNGDNRVRPWLRVSDARASKAEDRRDLQEPGESLIAHGQGIVDLRNRLLRAASQSSKVAAILGSDEHSFYRIFISPETPIGVMQLDDHDGDQQLHWPEQALSALPEMDRGVWFLTCGGGGAHYYSAQTTPWNQYWRELGQADLAGEGGFFYSSQENVLIFDASPERISLRILNRYGELIDWIDDLSTHPHEVKK
jgi:hypothetical protein